MADLVESHHLHRPQRLLFVGLALLVAVLYDFFIWDKQPGIGFLLFVCSYIICFLSLIVATKQMRQTWALLLLVPVVVLSVDAVLFNNEFIRNAGLFFVAVFLVLFSLFVTIKTDMRSFRLFNIRFISSLVLAPVLKQIGNVFHDITTRSEHKKSIYTKILLGVLIAVPLVLFFGSFFASADQIFDDCIKRLFSFNIAETTIWRLFRTFLLWVAGSAFFYVLISDENSTEDKETSVEKFDTTIVATVLVILNLLFLFFVFIQFKYLFGSYEYVVNNKIIFSEYARNGFFQLVWVVIFAALVFLVIYRSFSRHGMPNFLRVISALFIAQTGVVAASALKRMYIYQDAYGYTVDRLYVEWFIYLIFALLLLGIISVIFKLQFRTLIYTSMALGTVALVVVSSVNVDYMIARKNVDRFLTYKKELDVDYLRRLSVDIVPVFFEKMDSSKFAEIKLAVGAEGKPDTTVLSMISRYNERIKKYDSPLEFNFGIFKVKQLLTGIKF